jgi:hypothetical protein
MGNFLMHILFALEEKCKDKINKPNVPKIDKEGRKMPEKKENMHKILGKVPIRNFAIDYSDPL